MRRRAFAIGMLGAAVAALAPARGHAADSVTVTSSIGRAHVKVGEGVYFQVEVEVEGGRGSTASPNFPALEGLEIVERGTSSGTSISIMGGRRSASHTTTYTFVIVPTRAGDFPLDVRVEVDGKQYRATSVPVLQVTGVAEDTDAASEPADGRRPTEAGGEIFLWPQIDRPSVFVGEQIHYEFEVWERTDGEVSMRAMPTFQDFWSEELPVGEVRRDEVAGVGYRVHPSLRRALFPQRAGKLTIGGGEVQVRYGRPFGLFGAPSRRRGAESIAGPTIEVDVKPLPAAGQPPGFVANNVGRFTLRAAVDRATIAVGEALTLTLTVEGEGNIRLVEPGEWPVLTGLRRYDPKQTAPAIELAEGKLRGSKRYEFLVIAEQPGSMKIPAHELHYFDPAKGTYATARSEEIAIEIVGSAAANATAGASAGTSAPAPDPETVAVDPLTEVLALPVLPRSVAEPSLLDRRRWRLGVVAVPALLGAGWWIDRWWRLRASDTSARTRLRRRAAREEQLVRAERAAEGGEGFYAAVGALLHDAAGLRAGEGGAGLARDRLLALLATRSVAADELTELRELLDTCDAARFGSAAGDAASRREILRRARKLLGGAAWRIP